MAGGRAEGRLAGKRALITGAAGGLGAAMARAMAAEGARLLLGDVNRAGAQALADEICAAQGSPVAIACRHDVTSPESWQAALALAREELGGLSVLVNNAGLGTGGTIESTDLASWRQAFAVNVDGVFLGCQLALPLLRASTPAAIVNVGSVAGVVARSGMAPYGASKAAVLMLSRSVALHCAEAGWDVRCNCLMPGFADTPMIDGFRPAPGYPREKLVDRLGAQVPLGRIARPEEIAQGAVFLASDESRYMTGTELKLDGGLSSR
ncbi:MAG TPA: SDR family oxidoreductase [Novosphingobium sp.]|nr:SDR family oxidoreductase [Novosphingobium sp.]HZV08876.1 SDR family oxidoreductase [Novosphingobium sp.]